jgi:hypothetical protein
MDTCDLTHMGRVTRAYKISPFHRGSLFNRFSSTSRCTARGTHAVSGRGKDPHFYIFCSFAKRTRRGSSSSNRSLIMAAALAIRAVLVAAARCAPVARGCAARLRADTRVGPPEAPHGSLAGTTSADRDGQARAQGSWPPPARARGWPIGRRRAALCPPPYPWHPPICFLRASVIPPAGG